MRSDGRPVSRSSAGCLVGDRSHGGRVGQAGQSGGCSMARRLAGHRAVGSATVWQLDKAIVVTGTFVECQLRECDILILDFRRAAGSDMAATGKEHSSSMVAMWRRHGNDMAAAAAWQRQHHASGMAATADQTPMFFWYFVCPELSLQLCGLIHVLSVELSPAWHRVASDTTAKTACLSSCANDVWLRRHIRPCALGSLILESSAHPDQHVSGACVHRDRCVGTLGRCSYTCRVAAASTYGKTRRRE